VLDEVSGWLASLFVCLRIRWLGVLQRLSGLWRRDEYLALGVKRNTILNNNNYNYNYNYNYYYNNYYWNWS
jgi:hypothetical protein